MNEELYIYMFSKIAWDYGLLKKGWVSALQDKMGPAEALPISMDLQTPTTLYVMQYIEEGCQANCAFCSQGKTSRKKNKHSYLVANQMIRFPINRVKEFLKRSDELPFRRICIQTVLHDKAFDNLVELITHIKEVTNIPITADSIPLSREQIEKLYSLGLDRITINYELATQALFDSIRGKKRNSPYRWDKITESLNHALDIFGYPRVLSHLLIGVGETDDEALSHIQDLYDRNIITSIFSFRPLSGTDLESHPRITFSRFHKVQIASYIIKKGWGRSNQMRFDSSGNLVDYGIPEEDLRDLVYSGKPFITSGCPGCNRPHYTTDPGERCYTYAQIPELDEIRQIVEDLRTEGVEIDDFEEKELMKTTP